MADLAKLQGQILVAESDGEHPLADQRRQPVLDQVGAAIIAKTGSEPINKPDRLVRGTQQQCAGVAMSTGERQGMICQCLR